MRKDTDGNMIGQKLHDDRWVDETDWSVRIMNRWVDETDPWVGTIYRRVVSSLPTGRMIWHEAIHGDGMTTKKNQVTTKKL